MPGSYIQKPPVTRSRQIPMLFGRRYEIQIYKPTDLVVFFRDEQVVTPATQITTSEGHPWPPPKGYTKDLGGPFSTKRNWIEELGKDGKSSPDYFTVFIDEYSNATVRRYEGVALPVEPHVGRFPPDLSYSAAKLTEIGADLVNAAKPTNSVAEAAVSLGELYRDGVPSIPGIQAWQKKIKLLKASGSEFLNVVFGWQPLLSEILNIHKAVATHHKVLDQLERDSGKRVFRERSLPRIVEKEYRLYSGFKTGFGPSSTKYYITPLPQGDLYRERVTTRDIRFTGEFTYYVPDSTSTRNLFVRQLQRFDRTLGLSLTPETLWNLAPWSCAIDWVSNAGSVISNMSDWALYGLVMRYGYVTEHTVTKDTYTLPGSRLRGSRSEFRPITFVTETKKRVKANPFGFGVSWDGLSPLQYAILAALGLSRT